MGGHLANPDGPLSSSPASHKAMPRRLALPKTTSFSTSLIRPVRALKLVRAAQVRIRTVRCARVLRRRRARCHEGFNIALLKRSDGRSHVHSTFMNSGHLRPTLVTTPNPQKTTCRGRCSVRERSVCWGPPRPKGIVSPLVKFVDRRMPCRSVQRSQPRRDRVP
jgi:hypothetical protein